MDEAIDAREIAYAREASVRAELEQRGARFSVASASDWPATVRTQLAALGPWQPHDQVLARLGWTTDYYAENLRGARVPMDRFSARLDGLSSAPRDVLQLGQELLQYAACERSPKASDAARDAGLWLYVWGSCNCHVEAGQ
jgi:hypothetical protein